MIRYTIAFLASLLLLLCSVSGHAANLRIERAYFLDPNGSVSEKDLTTLPFSAFEGQLNVGITTGATWIRLTIAREPGVDGDSREPLKLRVGPSPLLRVQMAQTLVGTPLPASAFSAMGRCPDNLLCANLTGLVAEPVQVYLKVEGQGMRLIRVDVLTSEALMEAVMTQAAGSYISLTVAFALFVASVFLLLLDRSALTLAYVAFQITSLLVIVGVSGMLWPYWISRDALASGVYFLWPLKTAATILLLFSLIRTYQPSRWLRDAALVLLGACVLNLLLMALGQFKLALISNIAIYALNPLVLLLGLFMVSQMRTSMLYVLVCGGLVFSGLIVHFVFFAESGILRLGILHFGDLRFNGLSLSLFIFGCVMLERKHLAGLKTSQLEQLRIDSANNRHLDAQLKDRQSLVDMLTHELKNPLATIRFALSSLRSSLGSDSHILKRLNNIGSSAARMDKVLEHVASVNQIEMSQLPPTATLSPAAGLVGEVLAQMELNRSIDIDIQADTYFTGDVQMITTILENLLNNADAYGLPEQATRLRVGADAAFTELEVSNVVAADAFPDKNRIFERYYRHSTSLRLPGMGLGLSLVKTCAEKLGGTVNFLQREHNVVFLVRLPN